MIQTGLIGKNHTNQLDWLSDTWLQSGPPVCFLEGFPGTGKTTIARYLLEKVNATGISTILITAPDSGGDPTDDILLDLAMELSIAGHKELADAVDDGRSLTKVLHTIVEAPILIIIDEFQRTMRGESGRPAGGFAKVLSTIANRRWLKGRVLLLTNRLVERARWSEAYAIRTLQGMEPNDGVQLLDQLLSESERQDEIPAERRQDVVKWLGGNPRAMRVLVASLMYDSLDELIGLKPELWETKDRYVSAELVGSLERELLERTLNQLSDDYNRNLDRLAVYRKAFNRSAVEALFSDKSAEARFRRDIIDRFLMEQHRGWFNLHPIVREIGLQKLRQTSAELKHAHAVASQYYTRHFTAKQVVGWGRLGGHFVEARYHLVNADQEDELGEIVARFESHIRATISLTSPVPKDSEELDERIAVLSALLETPGAKGLEYHLARLFQARGRRNDLDRAIKHARRAVGPQAPADTWVLCANLLTQAGRVDEAIDLLKEGIQKIPADKSLFSLYQSCGELLTQAGRVDGAIDLLKEGIQKIPADKSLFSLYQSCGELLTQAGRVDGAIDLLKKGIQRIPADKGLFSLYQSCGELLAHAGRVGEAIDLLKKGIQKIPADKSLVSLYQSCGELLAQAGWVDEAIDLLKEGIQKIPADKNLFVLYQSCGVLLTQAGRVDEAITFLKQGVEAVPQQFGRYRLMEAILLLLAAQQDEQALSEYLNTGRYLDSPSRAFGQILLMQTQGRYHDAATFAATSRQTHPTYFALANQEAFSWLCAGYAQSAFNAFEKFPWQVAHGKGMPNSWLQAFILLKLGKADEAVQYLTLYLGTEWSKDSQLIEPTLLALWDRQDHPDLAYYYPTLPPSLTGLEHPVTRVAYHPSVLPDSEKVKLGQSSVNTNRDRSNLVEVQTTSVKTILEDKQTRGIYDVFLCHNNLDKPAVKRIGEALMKWGILPWLDEWDLQPGQRWQRVLQDQITKVKTAAVFVGPSGMGPWQNLEIEGFLEQFVKREAPVIPVVLPECEKTPTLPLFLGGFQWVDFRKEIPNPLDQLMWGITGKRPGLITDDGLGTQVDQAEESNFLDEIRNIVRQENEIVRSKLATKLDQTSTEALRQLNHSQVAIINALNTAIDENRIKDSDVTELLEAIRELRNNLPTEQSISDALQSLPPIVDDPKANVYNRLKLTVPIIPLLLSYEGEYELSAGLNLNSILQRVAERIRL